MAALEVWTLEDGGQGAEKTAERLVAWLEAARVSLDLALYDVRLPGPVGDRVADAIRAAAARGVGVRIAFNEDREPRKGPLPPPVRTDPSILETLRVPLRPVPGEPDLMHHKYVVRDGAAVWTGSTNWTLDSWEREENVLATVESPGLAAAYARDFEDLWTRRRVEDSGKWDAEPVSVDGVTVRPWFCPGRGEELSERIAACVRDARERIRIASPLLTAMPILQSLADAPVEVAGVCDATQVAQVFDQWAQNPHASSKAPLLRRILGTGQWSGKRSTPYAPGSVHDFMHAKVTVIDDRVFLGSFNLSRSGEQNAENVLEIADAALAGRMASWIDELRERYPAWSG